MPTDRSGAGAPREQESQDAASALLHQLNQPLTAIGNYAQAGCQLIDAGMGDSARLREIFEKIAAQSNRTIQISQQLKQALPSGR